MSNRRGHSAGLLDEPLEDRFNLVLASKVPPPLDGDARLAEESPGELSANGAGGVGVVTQVHRAKDGLPEIGRIVKRPERRLERSHDVSRSLNLRRLPRPKRTVEDLEDFRMEWGAIVSLAGGLPARVEHLLARDAVHQPAEDESEISAGGEALGAGMRRTARFDEPLDQDFGLVWERDRK